MRCMTVSVSGRCPRSWWPKPGRSIRARFDPLGGILDAAAEHDAWVHVDGAFGIWARVSPELAEKVDRLEEADSWAFDAHKWLNVPYDSGIAVCAHPRAHRSAMLGRADYLPPTPGERDAFDWTPEASRRARAFAVYAAVRSLGRSGMRDLVERCCALARRFADGLAAIPGVEVLNSVELNQVLLAIPNRRRHPTHPRARPAQWGGLDGGDELGRAAGDSDLCLELGNEHDRRRPHGAGLCRRLLTNL